MADERREHARECIELKVEYQRLNSFFADYTKNIGRGGTFIRTKSPLPIGTEFRFSLVIPKLEEALTLRGKVQWTISQEQASEERPAGMGIGFLWDSEAHRDRITHTVEELMRDTLGPSLSERLLEKLERP